MANANPDLGKIIFTYAGRELMAKCQVGKELHYSKFSLSDGDVEDDADLRSRTSLVNESKYDAPIVSVKVLGNGHAQIRAQISNQNLATGFFAKELGIFAVDPDTGSEILYAYANFANKSNYIAAGVGGMIQSIDWAVETIIDQATNITATIDGSAVFVTYASFNDHLNDTNPHPNVPTKMAAVTTPTGFWAVDGDQNLHQVSVADTRTAILGTAGTSIPLLNARISQLEVELANITMENLANEQAPDSNLILTEDFVVPDMVDTFQVRVISVVAGSNSIDLENLNGILVGSWYWISDGRNQEYVQVKSVSKNGNTSRVILTTVLQKTYSDSNTYLYRTTAQLQNGIALGSGEQKAFSIVPELNWVGVKGSTETNLPLDTSLTNITSFELDGDGSFDANGFFTLSA